MAFPQKDTVSNKLRIEFALRFCLYCKIKPENIMLSDDSP